MKSMFKKVNPRLAGVALLICIVGIIVVLYYCLYIIECTESTGATGAYYMDPIKREPISLSLWDLSLGLIFLLMPFYPLLKLSFSLIFGISRDEYYGLFIARSNGTRILSGFLTGLNIINIILFVFLCIREAHKINGWVCSTELDLCPNNSEDFMGYILLMFLFWGMVNLLYGLIHLIVKKKK